MKKAIIFFICIFTAVTVKAQEYKELNNTIYKINYDDDDSNPLMVLMVLKLDETSKTFQKTTLKKGKYQIKSVKEKNTIYKFTIDRKGLFQDKVYVEAGNNGVMTVRNSLIQLFEADVKDKYIKIIPNRKDSLFVLSIFQKKDDFKKQEVTAFFSKKHKGKTIMKEFYKDGSYFEINEITGKNKYANKNGKEIIQDQDKDDVEAVEPPPSRFYFPFAYKGKWGVVDEDNDEYVRPTYDGAYFPNDFSFILLTKKDGISLIINSYTGEKISADATYKSSVLLDDKEYLFFTDGKKSELIYLPDGDIKKLNQPYIYLETPPNYYKNSKGHKNYLLATLPNEQYALLNKNENLTPVFTNSYSEIGSFLDYTQSNENEYIYTIDENQKVTIYSPELKKVMKLKMKNIHLFTEKEQHKIAKKLKIKQLYYTPWYDSDESVISIDEAPLDMPYNNRFEINTEKQEAYYVNKKGEKQQVYFDNEDDVHFIFFGEKRKKTYIYIPKNYTKNTPLLLPKKYWD